LLIRQATRMESLDAYLPLARRLEDEAIDHELRAAGGRPADALRRHERASLDREMAEFLSHCLSRRGGVMQYYMGASAHYGVERRSVDLHTCGNRIFSRTYECVIFDALERVTSICERCGIIADTPSNIPAPPLMFDGTTGRVSLQRWRPGTDLWLTASIEPVGAVVEPPLVPWRVDRSCLRRPVEFEVPVVGRPVGMGVVSLAVVWDGDFSVIRAPFTWRPTTAPT
jgi:hypothetical protein